MKTKTEQIEQEFVNLLADKRLVLLEPLLPMNYDQRTLAMAVAVHLYKLLEAAESRSTE